MLRLCRKPKLIKVLCTYRAWARVSGSSKTWTDSIMIQVHRSGEIAEAFRWEMQRQFSRENPNRIGPVPKDYKLVSYLPQHGKRWFQSEADV